MASTYHRKDSPYIWISYKSSTGKWKNLNSGYRKDIKQDEQKAKKLAHAKTLEEMASKPIHTRSGGWDWTANWLSVRWGHNPTGRTMTLYKSYLRKWLAYFHERGLSGPATIQKDHVLDYVEYRKNQNVGRNQAMLEIRFFAMVMDAAIERGLAGPKNPARHLSLKTEPRKEKVVWSLDELDLVERTLAANDKYGWMHATFLMGRYQAVRLRQSQVPLSCISFTRTRPIIDYPGKIVKGGKGYSQPIDPRFFAELQLLVTHRQSLGKSMLCEVPECASADWRRVLDDLGLQHLSHHGLRATWITEAALSNISETLAMRFTNHASEEVHRIYQKITSSDLLPMLDELILRQAQRHSLLALAAKPSDVPQSSDYDQARSNTLPASNSPTFDDSPA